MTTVQRGSRTLGDRYELQEVIATGGMGQVWRGRDHLLARPVAVKVLRSEYADDPTFLARFRNEARHAAALTHPNIATVLDYGEGTDDATGEHLAYLVMELVEGAPLSTLIETEGPLDPGAALSVLRQAAAALAEAHRGGVVHRDVKPSNILVRPDGRVKLTDFGIAWSAECVPLTQTGQVIGTAQYMSPEQAAGERVGPASDVYALGLVGYESLTGHAAFTGTNPVTVALKQVREQPEPLPDDLPPDVKELIGAALTKDPGARLPDGAAFLAAVEEALDPRAAPVPPTRPVAAAAPVPGPVPEPAPVPGPEPRRRRRALVLLPLLLVALVVGGVLFTTTRAGDVPVADAAETQQAGIVLRAADFLGRPVAEVTDDLTALGLTVGQRGEQTPDAAPGTVVGLDPVDVELAAGDRVQVVAAVAPDTAVPEPEAPAAGPGPSGGSAPEAPAATPEAPAADSSTPGTPTPEAPGPEATTPEVTTPEVTTPEVTTPEAPAPEATTAESPGSAGTAPESTPEAPESTPSGSTTPEPPAPATGTPGDTAPPATGESPAPDAGTTSTGGAPATSPAPDAGAGGTVPPEPAWDGSPAGPSR
ncbi:protein kinase [Geodermatophilus sp. SYSU D00867]